MRYINLSGYKFTKLTNLEAVQAQLLKLCEPLDLKGSLILAEEGINAFASGPSSDIDAFIAGINPLFPGLTFKKSVSEDRPFKKLLIKIKAEIVTFGVPGLSPETTPAPTLSPETFKAWLDEKKDMIVLDTRNDYEVNLGQFNVAKTLPLTHFRQFPEAIQALPASYKKKTIVTYCTGGIRCEKAAPYLKAQGFDDVYQLDGGILAYLEKVGAAHFDGTCFVFDNRWAVDHELQETPVFSCLQCRQPNNAPTQQSPLSLEVTTCLRCAST